MSKISNICILDVRKANEETFSDITEIENVACMVYNDKTAKLLKDIKKSNIADLVKINDDDIEFIVRNGSFTLDKELLEETDKKLFLLINGICYIGEVPKQLLKDKVFKLSVNGEVVCPEQLKGIVDLKSNINGLIIPIKKGYSYMEDTIMLDEAFIARQDNDSKLSVEKLVAIDKIDEDMIKKQISNIQVLEDVITTRQNMDILRNIIDEFNKVELLIVPDNSYYKEDSLKIDSNNLDFYKDKAVISDDSITIKDVTPTELKDNITAIYCERLYCDDELNNTVRELSINDDMEILSNGDINNNGKLFIDNDYLKALDHKVIINNNGKLVFYDTVKAELAREKISTIINNGLIDADSSIFASVKIINKGKLRKSHSVDREESNDVIYENMVFLEL
ncbi:hypothetical protein SH1V18_33960 [Vallitalea longa]|uniref:Uncharacterized protein n=1 Tax=Vallitalea longa TaxID=2936439 RepID=A0A9W6DF67_9FIRM|nr:hypothetical protein [Vallitalea longa]GKX30916.1 hypothetical protein SH1V18_33960 [Vallitalea longa]